MIPPLQQVRLRSIRRWLQDNPETATLSPEALNSRVSELDEEMLEEFENHEDALKAQMMREGTWGTEQGIGQFQTDRLSLWSDVTSEFLPTSALQSED